MSEQAPNTMVTAIIIIIVIFVMGIMLITLFPDTVKPITDIFAEVFHAQAAEKADAESAATSAYTRFTNNIAQCEPGAANNPNGADGCACLTASFDRIPTGSYITIENSEGTPAAQFTIIDKNGKVLSQETKPYKLGLFAVTANGDQRKLTCAFPETFFITGEDKSDTLNDWHVLWDDKTRVKGATTFNFYRDDASSALVNAPIIHRISSTQYCLLTDLVEQDIVSGYEFSTNIKDILTTTNFLGTTSTNFNDVINEFKDRLYCTKVQKDLNTP
ncbi:hypothetical protein HZA98_01795 [Candidatus Woesearchaeota archaeon]|nr:hypothetical protein [Candidatus Woesearchaeota archaeon]